jgi:pimeloyl-ACP methyl ester carboxylesterase
VSCFAIVHAAGDGAVTWGQVADALRAEGHDVVAVDLPCEDDSATFSDYADVVVDAVGERDDEVVVVGHSLGGFTAPLVVDRLGAAQLVFVTGMVPRPGETATEWWSKTGHSEVCPPLDDEVAVFWNDLDPARVKEVRRWGRDQSGTPMAEPFPLTALPDVPTRFVLCTRDRFFPAGWTRGMVRDRLGIEPDEIDAGHCPNLSRPAELARLLAGFVGPSE